MNWLFFFTVIVPTLLSMLYFGLIASDIYISESRFVLRSPEKQTLSGLGALLQGAGFTRAQDDTYSVHDYILSRDALQQLENQFSIGKSYGSNTVDIISRFGGLDWDRSFEALWRYYQKRIVAVDTDGSSSISTLTVRAFSREDASRINESLLDMSEALVNKLNERGRRDMIRFAAAEVATAEQKAKVAALAVSRYRDQKSVFDPSGQSALGLQLVSKLQDELIATKNQLIQVQTLTRDNPQIPALRKRVEALQADIARETAKVAGAGGSLANKVADYERLKLESLFADKQLATALTSLEQARNDAQRKQFYLERIVQPNKPDVAIEPRRIRSVVATFFLGLVIWGILSILEAGVREHADR
jgi:capsular polysaccharide transport system permease protein